MTAAQTPSVPEFNNKSDHAFIDISSEQFREYGFPVPNGVLVLRIEQPLKLSVSASGGHRIFDALGVCHYVRPGWVNLSWKAKPGHPHFVA